MSMPKGKSGNPQGRPAMESNMRLKLYGSRTKILSTVMDYLDKKIEDLEVLKRDKSITALEGMVIGTIAKAIKGDRLAFLALLEPIIGKPMQSIDIDDLDSIFRDMDRTTLINYTEKALVTLKSIDGGKNEQNN